ncbi:NmrA family NAD(P)-binding protein [Kutzneria sp. NPDC052558]|uniref:NmrA family NAD(P)-binding protein n=1 Tax=Kutzneria sp. NPDC052558 TaxID=3364121 RepID=UPI0037C7F645
MDPLASSLNHGAVHNNSSTALILGGTGRTGSLLADALARRGIATRTAARRGGDVRFDWDDPATHPDALAGVDRLYLVTPVLRVRYADQVAGFLDLAEAAGVRHVTFLSAHNADRAPAGIDIAAVEAGLAARPAITHSILRPAWVMENFLDDHLPVVDGVITAPSGGGREAFVSAGDIAAVAAETLLDPEAHAGATYSLTGPQALTFGEVADIIAEVSNRHIVYRDIDQEAWIGGALAVGVPADYAAMLRWLTGAIITGNGAAPTGDIEKVTGRPATSFRAFAQRNAQAWRVAAESEGTVR